MGKRTVREVGGNRMRLKDESEWFKIPNHHPAIVSMELYEQVQANLLHFKCPKTPMEYTLRAKVFCGCCRHALHRLPRKIPAFACRYTKVDESAECHRLEIGEQELESLLFELISKQAQLITKSDSLSDLQLINPGAEQQSEYERQMASCSDEKRKLYEQFVLGEIDADGYKAGKSALDLEYEQLKRTLTKLQSETALASAMKSANDELRGLAETALSGDCLTRPLADLLIDKVYVYPDNRIEVEWKVADFAKSITI
jgi:hypothetical protein